MICHFSSPLLIYAIVDHFNQLDKCWRSILWHVHKFFYKFFLKLLVFLSLSDKNLKKAAYRWRHPKKTIVLSLKYSSATTFLSQSPSAKHLHLDPFRHWMIDFGVGGPPWKKIFFGPCFHLVKLNFIVILDIRGLPSTGYPLSQCGIFLPRCQGEGVWVF